VVVREGFHCISLFPFYTIDSLGNKTRHCEWKTVS